MSEKATARATVRVKAPRERLECCAGWNKIVPDERAQWRWQTLHELAHGRVPFSAQTYRDFAGVSPRVARDLLREAAKLGWVERCGEAGGGLYLGNLLRKR